MVSGELGRGGAVNIYVYLDRQRGETRKGTRLLIWPGPECTELTKRN
jgi:hypothetical protein